MSFKDKYIREMLEISDSLPELFLSRNLADLEVTYESIHQSLSDIDKDYFGRGMNNSWSSMHEFVHYSEQHDNLIAAIDGYKNSPSRGSQSDIERKIISLLGLK